jgi:hypothetical protein
MGGLLRRFTRAGICLVCFVCVGCVQIPYCLPEFNVVSAVSVPVPGGDVHIFRVDGTVNADMPVFFGCGARYVEDESHELARLQPTDRKTVPRQWTVGIEHGWCCVGLANQRTVWTTHTVAVRFYRRGYETITVGPGDVSKDLVWKPVTENTGLEKAVDELIDCDTGHYTWHYGKRGPASGENSAAHREALLFCAAEYNRIARLVTPNGPDADGLRSSLEKKSQQLKDLAAGEKLPADRSQSVSSS